MGWEEIERMPPRVRRKYLEIIRAIPPGRKIEIACELSDLTRELMVGGIRARHPGISDEDVRKEIIKRNLPEDLRRRVYGW
jgi:hypothetical protein